MGEWFNLVNQRLESLLRSSFFDTFSKEHSNLDRIRHVVSSTPVDSFIEYIKKHQSGVKNSTEAVEFRRRGNEHFVKKSLQKAIKFYDLSILNSELDTQRENLALSYGNRAACMSEMEKFNEALMDIQNAMLFEYPEDLLPKLLMRALVCHKALGQSAEGLKVVEKLAKLNIDSSKVQEIEQFLVEFEAVLQSKQNGEPKGSKKVELLDSSHQHVASMSAALDVRWTEEKGRHVVTLQPVKRGSVLFMERPFAAVLLPEFLPDYCSNCFTKLQSFIPCNRCTHVRYCSLRCRDKGESYHRYECSFLPLLHDIGVAHLSHRIIAKTSFKQLMTLRESSLAENPCFGLNEPYLSDYLGVFHLLPHDDKMNPRDLFHYSMSAMLLLICFKMVDYFPDSNLEQFSEDELFVGSLLLRHIQQLICNAHAISTVQLEDSSSETVMEENEVRLATAIYPAASLMNHACTPNIFPVFDGDTLIVKAQSDLKENEEVFNNYGPRAPPMPFLQRQKMLKEQYFFKCACAVCEVEQAAKSENKKMSDALTGNYKRALRKLNEEQYADALVHLNSCLSSLHIEQVDDLTVAEIQDATARCHANLGDFEKASQVLQDAVLVVERLYGEESVELGRELFKLAGVQLNAGNLDGALESSRRAQSILLFYLPPSDESMKELATMKNVLEQLAKSR